MSTHYVYRIHDGDTDELLYIGSSSKPRNRVSAHRRREWWPANPRIEIEEYPDRDTAYAAEQEAIERDRPRHNLSSNPDALRLDHAAVIPLVRRIVDDSPALTDEQVQGISALPRRDGELIAAPARAGGGGPG